MTYFLIKCFYIVAPGIAWIVYYYRFTACLSSSKNFLSALDKESGKEIFTGGQTGCKAVIIDDPSDTWSHDIKTFDKEIGHFGRADIKVLENGPIRATLRVTTSYGDSSLSIDWSL